jgi:hypothetical protein
LKEASMADEDRKEKSTDPAPPMPNDHELLLELRDQLGLLRADVRSILGELKARDANFQTLMAEVRANFSRLNNLEGRVLDLEGWQMRSRLNGDTNEH